jgi:hypothetical protein
MQPSLPKYHLSDSEQSNAGSDFEEDGPTSDNYKIIL